MAASVAAMTNAARSLVDVGVRDCSHLPAASCESRWYAAYTRAHHEKRVADQLRISAVEHFLPLYSSVRRRRDRRVTLDLPLFPGYVFVYIALRDRLGVLRLPGVARLVGFNGSPTPLPEAEMDAMRATLALGVRVEPHPFLTVGRKVRVKSGAMTGFEGVLVRRKRHARLIVSVSLIQRSMAMEIDEDDLEVVP